MAADAIERELRQVSSTLRECSVRLQSAERDEAAARGRRDAANAEACVLRQTLAWRRWVDRIFVTRLLPVVTIPSGLATAAFLAVDARTGWTTAAAATAVSAFAASIAAATYCLLVRSDKAIAARLEDVCSGLPALVAETEQAAARLNAERERISPVESRLHYLQQSLDRERQSVAYQRQRLFDRRWKEYRGSQFEDYLAEVFTALGYEVQQTGQSGDHGVDLVVCKNGRTVAIQAKGYADSVGNGAVREAYAGKGIYRCHACAVITNSRFTAKAVEAAEALGCCLIHEDNFREFVFGEVGFGV